MTIFTFTITIDSSSTTLFEQVLVFIDLKLSEALQLQGIINDERPDLIKDEFVSRIHVLFTQI